MICRPTMSKSVDSKDSTPPRPQCRMSREEADVVHRWLSTLKQAAEWDHKYGRGTWLESEARGELDEMFQNTIVYGYKASDEIPRDEDVVAQAMISSALKELFPNNIESIKSFPKNTVFRSGGMVDANVVFYDNKDNTIIDSKLGSGGGGT